MLQKLLHALITRAPYIIFFPSEAGKCMMRHCNFVTVYSANLITLVVHLQHQYSVGLDFMGFRFEFEEYFSVMHRSAAETVYFMQKWAQNTFLSTSEIKFY